MRYISTESSLTFVAGGKSYTVHRDHPNYEAMKTAIREDDEDGIVALVDIPKTIRKFTGKQIEIRDDKVYYKGEEQHSHLIDRILAVLKEELPVEPLLRFLDNLMKNPSQRASQELYSFLEHKNLPITEDGCFLGYKRVRADWTDINSGKFTNTVGTINKMRRNTVDENWRNACSSGFHVGSLEYVSDFNSGLEGSHVIIVKVNPRDVVAVPSSENSKLRTCKYEVVGEYDGPLTSSVYRGSGPVQALEAVPDWDDEELDMDLDDDLDDDDYDLDDEEE